MTEADFRKGISIRWFLRYVVDILMGIPGVQFGDAWNRRINEVGLAIAVATHFPPRPHAKLASGRPLDLIDADILSQSTNRDICPRIGCDCFLIVDIQRLTNHKPREYRKCPNRLSP